MVQFNCMLLVLILVVVVNGLTRNNDIYYTSNEFIELINSKTTTWKAGRNFPQETKPIALKNLAGLLIETNEQFTLPTVKHKFNIDIPKTFDSRDHWPFCPSIAEIRDQGPCGSCWAVAAVETMSDRACIHSGGKTIFRFSSEDLLSCCGFCGSGCKGGMSGRAWIYWIYVGIVSGGPYKSNKGCRPYELPPCEHHVTGPRFNCSIIHPKTPVCVRECQRNYPISYEKDRKIGQIAYRLKPNVKSIQMEIMLNGPVEAAFKVYHDFTTYKSGVYQHVAGKFLAHHAIRIIGWGVENGVDYWLIANSWNTDWGDKGFFKMIRGINHLNIESMIVAGIPAN